MNEKIKLCKCNDEEIIGISLGFYEYFPLENNSHTNFYLSVCDKCNGFFGFPDYNFKLVLNEGKEYLRLEFENELLKIQRQKNKNKERQYNHIILSIFVFLLIL